MYQPTSGNLDDYGGYFPDFIANFTPAQVLGYLPDIARLEQYKNHAYIAKDDLPMNIAALQAVAPEDLPLISFILHPSVAFLKSIHPLYQILKIVETESEAESVIELRQKGEFLLIYRHNFKIQVTEIIEEEYIFLEICREKGTLEQAYNAISSININFDISQVMVKFILNGVIVNFLQ